MLMPPGIGAALPSAMFRFCIVVTVRMDDEILNLGTALSIPADGDCFTPVAPLNRHGLGWCLLERDSFSA